MKLAAFIASSLILSTGLVEAEEPVPPPHRLRRREFLHEIIESAEIPQIDFGIHGQKSSLSSLNEREFDQSNFLSRLLQDSSMSMR